MPYDYLTINPEQLNFGLVSASYFDTDLQKLYEQTLVPEKGFFGDGDDDIVELSLYDANQNILGFNRIIPKVTYSVVQGSFRDINNNLQSYSYANPNTNIVRYSNEILLHSQFDLNYNQVSPGLYYVLYNPIRNIAGNQTNNLVIKEVSPSRTELRLSFAFDTVKNEQSRLDSVKIRAFADKKYIFLQIEDNFVTIVDNNPIEQDFAANENQYNLYEISQLLGFKNKADLQEYISSTYYGFNKIIKTNITTEVLETKTFVGIAEQIKNFSYRYNDVEFIKEEILESLRIIVLKVSQDRILERTSLNPISLNIVLDFFQKVIYNDWLLPKVSELLDNYYNNFYDYYKNSLNFNNGRLIKILNHTSYFNEIDNSVNIQIKLDEPLPTEFDVKTLCWISNISIAPIYFKVNLFTQQLSRKVYLNGVNFNVEVPTVSPTNQKFEDNNIDTLDYAKVKLKQRINDLFINFDDFNDFINYSSAELRSKIAKNKILYYANLENEKNLLITTAKNSVYSISASYSRDVKLKTQEQISLLNTFDDYESYLFFNTSSINEKIENGISFDKNNYNSLTYQLPEYIRTDTESADYLKFTAMIGHFFDNILVFIKKFPKNYPIVNDDRNNYPKNYIEELLNSLNWNVNIAKFEQSDLNQLYFTNTETTGSLSSSYFDYAKSILNRLTNNISAIYKSKGTGTSFDLIRTIFGIPKELIQIKEYGSPDILSNKTSFYEYDTLLYFTKFDRDNYLKFNHTGSDSYFVKSEFQSVNLINNNLTQSIEYTSVFQGVSSVELSFRLNSINYEYGEKIPLIKKDRIFNDWSIYIKKDKQKESGTVIFEINPVENEKTSSIRSLELPFFNNNFYTLLLKREVLPGFTFDAVSFSSSLQKNQYPSIVLENEPAFNNFVVEDDGDFVAIPPILNKLTQSFFIESSRKYVPHLYTLEINQYDGEQLIFNSKSTKIITYETNRFFSSGSYYIGNYPLSNNNFVGNIDKLKVFKDAISDADFNEHSYNLNSISIENKSDLYSNLFYLWSFDTPINLYNSSSISSSILNQNLKYQLNKFEAFNFKQTDKYFSSPICATLKVDEFPYQFDVLKIKQVINTNNFGPNFAGNNKINKISETVSSNLVPYDYSTFSTDIIGDDSSLVQFSISPYDYLNEKIKDFVGKEGITNIIGDPKYLTAQNYPELVLLQKDFKKFNQKYIYPQEFFTTYKFYIDFSIFEFVKNLKPARVNLLTGLVLQPSLLERKKFGYKDVNFSNTSILSINFDNKTNLDLSIKNTNFTSSNTTVSTLDNQYKTDHNTYNFHQFQIKDTVDDRDFIYCKYGKLVKMSDNGFLVRDVNLVNDKESYQLVNNRIPINQNINGTTGTAGTAGSSGTSGTSGKLNVNRDKSNGYVCTFSSSFDRVEIIGSGSGYSLKINPYDSSGTSGTSGKNVYAYNLQITGSKELLNPYYGVRNSGYSRKHLSKTRLAGSRYRFIALSGSKYTIQNGIKILNPVSDYKITYYDYIKGKNDSNTTVNRQGIPNGSEPIISVPGFLSLDVDSNNFPIYGKVLTPEGSAAGTFESLPLTASQCTSASLNTYIKNL